MPDMSRLCCSADGQFPNVVFPTSYGTLEIIRININRVSLKYYVSLPDAIGKTYTGSYHSNSDFSGWFDFLTNADIQIYNLITPVTNGSNIVTGTVPGLKVGKACIATVSTTTSNYILCAAATSENTIQVRFANSFNGAGNIRISVVFEP